MPEVKCSPASPAPPVRPLLGMLLSLLLLPLLLLPFVEYRPLLDNWLRDPFLRLRGTHPLLPGPDGI